LREHASEIPARDYEMMIVVAPTVSEEGLPEVVERISGFVTAQGGEIQSTVHENPWGRRRLAYPINDHRDAFYVLYRFTANPDAILEIEREIKLDETVIRDLVVRYDEMTEHTERPPRERPDAAGGPGSGSMPFRRTPATATAPAPAASGATETEAAAATPAEAEAEAAETSSPAASAETVEPAQPDAAAVEATTEGRCRSGDRGRHRGIGRHG
jgi:small subunit ribosomal protein S6